MIEAFSADRLPGIPRASRGSDRPVFIAGMPRSGTTLVEQIIDAHPDAHGAGEIEDLIFKVCGHCHASYGGELDVCPEDGTRLRERSMLGRKSVLSETLSVEDGAATTSELKKYCPHCLQHTAHKETR